MYNTLVRRGAAGQVPYDAEIEYLECTGTQYIDTGILAPTGALMEAYILAGAYDRHLFGSHNPSNNSLNDYNRNTFSIYKPNQVQFNKLGWYYPPFRYGGASINTWYNVSFDTRGSNRIGIINGSTIVNDTNTATLSSINNIRILFDYYSNIPVIGKIKSFKLTTNTVVRDMISVRVGQVGYLYDKVSGQLFGNSGTGEFILGPDKNSVTIISQQQQHEMYG